MVPTGFDIGHCLTDVKVTVRPSIEKINSNYVSSL